MLDQSADDYWNRYQLTFALYSVSDRAIPSAFDGLKPGQRRLLYQMHDSRLLPGNKPQKSSKVCSAVTGNLHPHGGASMYGAAALMAAEFQRVKVIDGQGAFPRIQGDIPAADRYTEMRLSAPGAALTAELDDHAVPMVQTFDGEWTEPTMLPAQWPVLLCNGAVGIAEGWATKVPAHNPREVMAACRALLARPNTTDDTLMKLIPGPDWGCGSTVVGTAGLREYITTGRGLFTVRGTVSVDGKNVIVTELPPGVASNTVQERIRALVESGEMSGVADMSDLTDRRNGLRIVVTAKRGHSAETIRDQLLALTPLESTFAASLVALDEDRVPRWWSVRELIGAFLHLRDSVVLRRSEYRLDKVTARRHLVAGLMTIHLDIDAAVAVIRGSDTVDDARQGLQERFKIDEEQANYVLGLQLRRLTKLDVIELQAEAEKLDAEFAELTELVSNPDARRRGDRPGAGGDRETVQGPRIRPSHRAGLRGHPRGVPAPTRTGRASGRSTPPGGLTIGVCSPTATATCSPRVWVGRCGPTDESSSRRVAVCPTRSATSRWPRTSSGWCVPACWPMDTTWLW